MIKEIPIANVVLLVDKTISMLQLSNELKPLGEKAKLQFVEPQPGAGFLQWTLQGDDWLPFSELDDEKKPLAAKEYQDRCLAVKDRIKNALLRDAVLTVPSEKDFVFFRQNGGDWEIALTAWGYRYVESQVSRTIGAWVKQIEYQEFNVGFIWNGSMMRNMPFMLDELQRSTGVDGWFRSGGQVAVGKKFTLKTNNGLEFPMTVEKGKSDYLYDITQYVHVEIEATKDGVAMGNRACEVSFNGSSTTIETDESGHASLKMPLVCNDKGDMQQPQPPCSVTCMSQTQQKIPISNGETLRFDFALVTEKEEPVPPTTEPEIVLEPEPEPVTETKFVKIRLLDYGGYPMPDLPFKLTTKKKGEMTLRTDEDGYCQLPQDWFTDKEKMQVNLIISPEYQDAHDLHLKKNKKK